MDEMEFTEAESNMQDLVAEYQQCACSPPLHDCLVPQLTPFAALLQTRRRAPMTRRSSTRRRSRRRSDDAPPSSHHTRKKFSIRSPSPRAPCRSPKPVLVCCRGSLPPIFDLESNIPHPPLSHEIEMKNGY